MKINLINRHLFWNINNKTNYSNNTICILNDEFKVNILLITKCGSTSIRNFIDYREKLYNELNENEKKYTKICFVRDPEKRFYSGLNTILQRNNRKTKKFLSAYKKANLIDYILNNKDEHLTSMSLLIKNINVEHIYNLDIINKLPKKPSCPTNNKVFTDKIINEIRDKNIFSDDKLVNYYKEDFNLYSKATKYVIPKVSKLFKNF